MGQVKVKIDVVNWADMQLSAKGYIPSDKIRRLELDALVDTGAASLNLPVSVIEKLGLIKADERIIRTANGTVTRKVYAGAWVTILGRSHIFGVVELPDDCPPLIGVVVLEELDLVPNPTKETLEPNPAHGGEWTSYAY
ncbi:MAG: aspartyl protease family protein [candidate division Zixibacteria bacterium]|nr:aspartyl protease family protein [Candidatus Tariuqbacter arcticus]